MIYDGLKLKLIRVSKMGPGLVSGKPRHCYVSDVGVDVEKTMKLYQHML